MKLIIADILVNNDPSQTAAKNTTNFIHNARFVYFMHTVNVSLLLLLLLLLSSSLSLCRIFTIIYPKQTMLPRCIVL
jgi:hypothetical protein